MMHATDERGTLRTGDRVEKYVVEGVLGEGGMACVYQVRHVTLDTIHALKVLTHHHASVRARLLLEGRVQAGLRHANIVAVTDVIELPTGVGLVLEFVAGASLDELLARKTLSLDQVDQLAEGIFRGVRHAHDCGLVHRDLKPANILLQLEGRRVVPKVADFGLVKSSGGLGTTRTGVAMGTPRYMSPEQIRDAKSVDARADVFALGAILYELVTGRAAFSPDVDDVLEIFNAIADGRYTPAKVLRPDLPARMSDAIDGALAPLAEDRLPSVAALRAVWFDVGVEDDLGWELDPVTQPLGPTEYPSDVGSVLATLVPTPAPAQRVLGRAASTPSDPRAQGASKRLRGIALAGAALFVLAVAGSVGWLQPWSGATTTLRSPVPSPDPGPPGLVEPPAEPPLEPVREVVHEVVGPAPERRPRPAPARSLPEAPATAPVPVVEPAPEPPAPVEAQPPAPVTSFRISGARGYLRAGGVDHGPGPIEPGTYTVLATFEDLPITVQSNLTVAEGQQVWVKCTATFRLCQVEVTP